VTKAEKKHIKQLQNKKYRKEYGEFIVEGGKSIKDFIQAGFIPVHIYGISVFMEREKFQFPVSIIDTQTLRQISFLKNPKDAVAIFKIPPYQDLPCEKLIIALDNIQDPGNLGTIIRTADWFGIRHIVCSKDTVDCYNPKVVQATMGSLANVKIHYTGLKEFLQQTSLPVFGTFLEGDNIYQTKLPDEAVIVIGNEGNGIRNEIKKLINTKLYIPKQAGSKAESLNAAVATAIVVNEFVKNIANS
jgi:TrmH family RNA methyltransferase